MIKLVSTIFLFVWIEKFMHGQRWYYTGKFQNERVERSLFEGSNLLLDTLFQPQKAGQTFLYSGGIVIKALDSSSDSKDEEEVFLKPICSLSSIRGDIQSIQIQSRMVYSSLISHNYAPLINDTTNDIYRSVLEAEIGLFDGKTYIEKRNMEVGNGNLTALVLKANYIANEVNIEIEATDGKYQIPAFAIVHRIAYASDYYGRNALVMHTWQPDPSNSMQIPIQASTNNKQDRIRVMTYNLWHNNPPAWVYPEHKQRWDRYNKRLRHFADIVVEKDPDIILLQEVRLDSTFFSNIEKLPFWTGAGGNKSDAGSQVEHLLYHLQRSRAEQNLSPVDYQVVYQPAMFIFEKARLAQRNEEGVMILSKSPLQDVQALFLPREIGNPSDDHQRVLLIAKVAVGKHAVEVATSHFSLLPEARMRGVDMILQHYNSDHGDINHERCTAQLLMGDFNAEPQEPSISVLVGDQVSSEELAKNSYPKIFSDIWTDINQQEDGFTFPACDPVKRIDYILMRHSPDSEHCKDKIRVLSTEIAGKNPTKDTEYLVGSREGLGMNDLDSPLWASDHFAVLADLTVRD